MEKEVEAAYEEEQQRNKLIIFPIRLDDAVMKTNQAWAADIRRMRVIGDFREKQMYQKALIRVLRDLKVSEYVANPEHVKILLQSSRNLPVTSDEQPESAVPCRSWLFLPPLRFSARMWGGARVSNGGTNLLIPLRSYTKLAEAKTMLSNCS